MPFGVNPSALTVAGYLLGDTSILQVGTAIAVYCRFMHRYMSPSRATLLDEASGGRFDLGGRAERSPWWTMRSSAATDEYACAETDPLITFHITDLQHQRSSSGSSPSVSARSRRGPGLPREGVQWHRRSADQTQLHAAPCAWTTHSLRHLLSRAANVLICLMSARSIPCMSLRFCMVIRAWQGVERTQLRQTTSHRRWP